MTSRSLTLVPNTPGVTAGDALCAVAVELSRVLGGRRLTVATGPGTRATGCADHLVAEMGRLQLGIATTVMQTCTPVAAVRAGVADLAVADLHAAPRISETLPLEVNLAGILRRRPARHGVITARPDRPLEELRANARVGTTSPRCAAQLLVWRDDLRVELLVEDPAEWRGLVDAGALDALVLDHDRCPSGLERWLVPEPPTRALGQGQPRLLPGAGAGTVGIVARVGPEAEVFIRLAGAVTDPATRIEHAAEQSCLIGLASAGVAPDSVAVHARARLGTVTVAAVLTRGWQVTQIGEVSGPVATAAELGLEAAAELVDGAGPTRVADVVPFGRRHGRPPRTRPGSP